MHLSAIQMPSNFSGDPYFNDCVSYPYCPGGNKGEYHYY